MYIATLLKFEISLGFFTIKRFIVHVNPSDGSVMFHQVVIAHIVNMSNLICYHLSIAYYILCEVSVNKMYQ